MSNLNWKTSWQDLKDKFRESGEVVYANVVRDDDGELKTIAISPLCNMLSGPRNSCIEA